MKLDRLTETRRALIERHQFYPFLEQLQAELRETHLSELEYELSSIINTYDALLDYFCQGADDPERLRVYRQLVGQALLIGDHATLAQQGATEYPYYTAQSKAIRRESIQLYRQQLEAFADVIRTTTDSEELKQLAATHDRQLTSLFNDLWTQNVWNTATAHEIDKILLSPTITEADQCTIVSAVTLSLLRMFDPLKMLFLCDAYYHQQTSVSMRALVGIVIACYSWADRIEWYNEVSSRLSLLTEDPIFGNQVCEIVMQFIRSTGTEEVDRKMREEIIPGLMKNPKLRQMPGISKEDLEADDINPDWEQWMHESGLEHSMREISEWQMEGVDVNMSTFAQLKRYPFFYNIIGWFRPFDIWNADMLAIVGNPSSKPNALASTVLQSAFMCDSDKYSFCYAIREIPQMQRDAMMAQLEEQSQMMKEHADTPDLKQRQTAQSAMRQYVQNLYRFFKLFPNVAEFDNPFTYVSKAPLGKNPLHNIILEGENAIKISALCIKQKYYDHAIKFFTFLRRAHSKAVGAVQLQQLGLCYQKIGNFREAIKTYEEADLLKPDSYWTISHLAHCHREIEEFDTAVKFYKIAESMKPDNLSLTYHTAEVLCKICSYDEALPRLNKLYYHHPESFKVIRMLAECNLNMKRGEQAIRYYECIMKDHTSDLTSQDLRYAAYSYWITGYHERCFKTLWHAEKLYPKDKTKLPFVSTLHQEVNLLNGLFPDKEEPNYLCDAYCKYRKNKS